MPAPFGFSIGDIVLVTLLIQRIIREITTAPSAFREFSADLQLALSLFQSLETNWNTYADNATRQPLEDHHETLRAITYGIRTGLEALSVRMREHAGVGSGMMNTLDNRRFTRELADLRRRLQMNMGSVQLLISTVAEIRGRRLESQSSRIEQQTNRIQERVRRMERVIQLIRNAQLEQQTDDEVLSQLEEGGLSHQGEALPRSDEVNSTHSHLVFPQPRRQFPFHSQPFIQEDVTSWLESQPFPALDSRSTPSTHRDLHSRMTQVTSTSSNSSSSDQLIDLWKRRVEAFETPSARRTPQTRLHDDFSGTSAPSDFIIDHWQRNVSANHADSQPPAVVEVQEATPARIPSIATGFTPVSPFADQHLFKRTST